ncbi:MAG: tRNA (adenosine(37)-N6)-threonylcarbamoyltransferase complex dimerization subunit type 1 TsaB [Pseudomonadota bacterium]
MTEKQTILAIETSTTGCSAALLIESQSGSSIYESYKDAPRQHTELILPMLDDVLQQADSCLSDIDALAFGCGPGAFTGVRIATSVIQAISYAADIKVISVSSLAALAQGAYRRYAYENIVVLSDARMSEVYLACYQNHKGFMTLIGEERLVKPEYIGDVIGEFCTRHPQWFAVGSGWLEYQKIIEPQLSGFPYVTKLTDNLPHAQDVAVLAVEKLANNQYGDAISALPVYLRNDVAKKSVDRKNTVKNTVNIL